MNDLPKISISEGSWLAAKGLQYLFDILEKGGEEARVNGGAVRNSLLGEAIGDVDISTTIAPKKVMERLQKANIKAIPTGLDHGTVTAVIEKTPYEITTLRRDVSTDGRRAVVEFTRDWLEDANRRDLTMNGLYCDRYGKVFDPLKGYGDLSARNVRFIGDAGRRIEEDYLRILRFFRFFAQYGQGRPDGEGLRACARLKSGIVSLSAERIWAEFKKILQVQDPSRALLWMRTTGVLNVVLPESEKWGIDFFTELIGAEHSFRWPIDPMSRIQIIVPPTRHRMQEFSDRMRLSKAESKRMQNWVQSQLPAIDCTRRELARILYNSSVYGVIDRLRNEIVRQRYLAREDDDALERASKFEKLLDFSQSWERPKFPVSGKDLQKSGLAQGPEMGVMLKSLENMWVESNFELTQQELLSRITQ